VSYFPETDDYFGYFDPRDPPTLTAALDHLEAFIAREGPYDAVLAYSHGAQLVASMLARLRARDPAAQPFRCAIFISGGIPYEPEFPHGAAQLRHLDPQERGVLLHLPTANIWGRNDLLYPNTSKVLSALCRPDWKTEFVHEGGHDVPGPKAKEDLLGCVKAIRRTVDRALVAQ
jgi:hypothetical protein